MLRRGIEVEIEARRGTWSEVSLVSELSEEEGYRQFQAWLINTLSSLMRVGTTLLFD
jgi:hypothetical protein